MIERSDLLALDFYKKEKFTGSRRGMRYLIKRETEGDAERFDVFTWKGPYSFAATDEEKEKKTFPFSDAALEEITSYLNRVYEKKYAGTA